MYIASFSWSSWNKASSPHKQEAKLDLALILYLIGANSILRKLGVGKLGFFEFWFGSFYIILIDIISANDVIIYLHWVFFFSLFNYMGIIYFIFYLQVFVHKTILNFEWLGYRNWAYIVVKRKMINIVIILIKWIF